MADLTAVVLFQDHYKVLGCRRSATGDDLTRAYQRLAWKYHPRNQPQEDEEKIRIFIRLGEAYKALVGGDGKDEEKGARGRFLTLKEAKQIYKDKFGQFRKDYYEEGGIIGLPHSFVLTESIAERDTSSGSIACGMIRIGFLRSWYLKSKIDLVLSLAEVICTVGAIVACAVSFVLDKEHDWFIGVVGGVGLLLSYFLLSVWYGFTRFPVLVERGFISWLWGSDSGRKDLEEIRDVCSEFFHGDKKKRGQGVAIVLCIPVMLIDQMAASIMLSLLFVALFPFRSTMGVSAGTEFFLRGLAKSTGAVIACIVYYSIWIMGGNIVKACVVASLLVNQALYSSILCRMGFLEFVGLQLFRGVISLSSTHREESCKVASVDNEQQRDLGEIRYGDDGVEVIDREINTSRETIQTYDESIGDSPVKASLDSPPGSVSRTTSLENICIESTNQSSSDSFSSFVVARIRSTGANTIYSSGSSELVGDDINLSREIAEDDESNLEILPVGDRWLLKQLQMAPPGTRGSKTIDFTGAVYTAETMSSVKADINVASARTLDFTGDVYSARLEDDRLSEDRISSANFQMIFQGIKEKMNQGLVAVLRSGSSLEYDDSTTKNQALDRSSTLGSTACNSSSDRSRQIEFSETLTIISDIESSLDPFDDPRIAKNAYAKEKDYYEDQYDDPPLELLEAPISPHPTYSYEDYGGGGGSSSVPRGVFIPTTNGQSSADDEVPPPAYSTAMDHAKQEAILAKHSCSMPILQESSTTLKDGGDTNCDKKSIESSLSPDTQRKQTPSTPLKIGKTLLIPTHVNLLGTVGSVDDEDLTIFGLDPLAPSPARTPTRKSLPRTPPLPPSRSRERGRRPAPGTLDLSPEPVIVPEHPSRSSSSTKRSATASPLSTKQCDQFVYIDPPPYASNKTR